MESSKGQLKGSEVQLEGSVGQLEGLRASRGGTDEQTNEGTDGQKISPFYRTSSPTGAAAQKGRKRVRNLNRLTDREIEAR